MDPFYENVQKQIEKKKDEQRVQQYGEYGAGYAKRGEESGLEGPQLGQYVGLAKEARGLRTRERRSQAAQDIMRQQQELASAQMGVGAAARGPFAGATQQAAQRAVGASGAQAAAQAAAADLAYFAKTLLKGTHEREIRRYSIKTKSETVPPSPSPI